MKENFTAMILAAGYGTRLRPVTDEIPKPMIPVGDRTLLENILLNLRNAGIAKFAVNTHHLADIISDSVSESLWNKSVNIFYEEEILGTGGPILNAKKLLKKGDGFLLHNGDILTDISLEELLNTHNSNPAKLVTMVMIDGPENRVAVNSDRRIIDILGKLGKEEQCRLFTYAGIACFSRRIFDYLPDEIENCSIITAILKLMRDKPDSVAAYIPGGNFIWNDLGTVEKFVAAHKDISSRKMQLPSLLEGEKIFMPLQPLKQQGSGRIFFRIQPKRETQNKILMCASDDNSDFSRFTEIGKFLYSKELGVPEIISVNSGNHTVIMEDLGDDTLYNLVKKCGNLNEIEALYRRVIQWLVKFQTETYDDIAEENNVNKKDKLRLRMFDYNYLRWETQYFKDNFLKKYCEMDDSCLCGLDDEFHALAEDVLTSPQVMIHRDFQSQNIMIKHSEVYVVDFQGARIGHIAYDLMSLLNDPYIALDKDLRYSLFEYFFNSLAETPLIETLIEKKALRSIGSIAHAAALQRGMQALGAYTFLSIEKKKKQYRKFISPALKILRETLDERDEYLKLKSVLDGLAV
jgi:aminoglycoside/choline kinase family phosphotransferase/CTP:molybdopterin cytidylyltransferase MocA